jgi:hypothetical protein
MDEFDSEKNEIRLDGKKVEISSLDDLFPFLWNIPWVACCDNENRSSVAEFGTTGTWWEQRYGETMEMCEKEIDKLEKRLKRAAESRKPKILQQIEEERDTIETMKRCISRLDGEMEEIKEAIRHDNM